MKEILFDENDVILYKENGRLYINLPAEEFKPGESVQFDKSLFDSPEARIRMLDEARKHADRLSK